MKNILKILLAISLLIPSVVSATTSATWISASTTVPYIQPNTINGVQQGLKIPALASTGTTCLTPDSTGRIATTTCGGTGFLALDGSNANTNIDIQGYNFTAGALFTGVSTDTQALTVTGTSYINGNSDFGSTPLYIQDDSTLADDSTDSFTVYASDSGTYGIQVKNAGSVHMANSTYQFLNSGDVYLGSAFVLNSSGQLRIGGGSPIYAQLESISTTQTHFRIGYNDTYYVQENVSSLGAMTFRPSVNNTAGYGFQNSGGTTILNVDTTNARVGVNITTPSYQFDARGTATSYIQARSSSENSTAGFLLRNDARFWSMEVYGAAAADDFRIFDQTAGATRLQINGSTGAVSIGMTSSATGILLGVNGKIGGGTFTGTYLDVSGGVATLLGNSGVSLLAGSITATFGMNGGATHIVSASSASVVHDFNVNSTSAANNTFFRFGNGTVSVASSGVTNIISSTPSINQSGTAGYTAFNINVTETATGSGAKNFAKWAVGGTTMFNVDNAGATTIGAGSNAITKVYSSTATLDFGSIGSNSTAELTMTVTGASTGDSVFLGAPSTIESGLIFTAYVSATNTVTVRVHNTSGGSIDPASATWRATVIKF